MYSKTWVTGMQLHQGWTFGNFRDRPQAIYPRRLRGPPQPHLQPPKPGLPLNLPPSTSITELPICFSATSMTSPVSRSTARSSAVPVDFGSAQQMRVLCDKLQKRTTFLSAAALLATWARLDDFELGRCGRKVGGSRRCLASSLVLMLFLCRF